MEERGPKTVYSELGGKGYYILDDKGQRVPSDAFGRPLPKYEGIKTIAMAAAVGGLFWYAGMKVPRGRPMAFRTEGGGTVSFFGAPEEVSPRGSQVSTGTMVGLWTAAAGCAIIVYGLAKSQ